MDNDILPPGYAGGAWVMPEPQIKAVNQKRDDTLSQLPLLKEVLDHFDTQIALLGSVDSITADLSRSAATFQKQVEANRLARNVLKLERGFIQSRIDNV